MKRIDIRLSIPRHPTIRWKRRKKAKRIVIHTTASNNQDPNKTARWHIKPGSLGKAGAESIAYHDFITKLGVLYHCNDYACWTWHAGLYNRTSIGIALAFTGQTGEAPSDAQMKTLQEQLTILCLYLKILPKDIIGHREVPDMWSWLGKGRKKYKKTCPGMGIDLDLLRTNITGRLQRRLSAEGLYLGPIDYKFGKKSKAALKAFKPNIEALKRVKKVK